MPNTLEKQLYLQEELMTCFHMNSTTTSFIGPMYWSGGDDGEIHLKPKEIAASFSCSTVLVCGRIQVTQKKYYF